MKAGVAQKAIEQARKPENQAKAKKLFAQASEKFNKRGKPTAN